MATQSSSLETIHAFLAQKRIAMVGVSRDLESFSAKLFAEFCRRGYDMVPVNPGAPEIFGRRCFARVQEIHPPVEAALLMTRPEVTDVVVNDCAQAKIRFVWMHRAIGMGAVSEGAIAFCQSQKILVIPGECPFMFLPGTELFHRIHGFIRRITGGYPGRA